MTKPNSIRTRLDDRWQWLAAGKASEHAPLNEHQLAAVIRLTEEGASLVEIANMEGMPTVSAVYRETYTNEAFAQAMQAARAAGATTAIEEAQHNLRLAAAGNDTDAMVIASSFHRGSLDYAAKIAPKEYGQLVKLSDANGNALNVNVVSYAALEATGNITKHTQSLACETSPSEALQGEESSATS